jgi:hypothetical protein
MYKQCFPVCRNANRRVYMHGANGPILLGFLNDKGELVIDPDDVAAKHPKEQDLLLRIAIASDVDLTDCRLNPAQWKMTERSPEETLRMMRAAQDYYEHHPREANAVIRDLCARVGGCAWRH